MTYAEDLHEATHPLCDKCGQPVPRWNDRTYLEVAMTGNIMLLSVQYARHLLPVVGEDHRIACEGSPSLAQYLPGQPRDNRGYEYDPKVERAVRVAYEVLQRWAKPKQKGTPGRAEA